MHVLRQAADAQLAFHPWHEERAQAQGLNANVNGTSLAFLPTHVLPTDLGANMMKRMNQDEHNKQSHQVTERQI